MRTPRNAARLVREPLPKVAAQWQPARSSATSRDAMRRGRLRPRSEEARLVRHALPAVAIARRPGDQAQHAQRGPRQPLLERRRQERSRPRCAAQSRALLGLDRWHKRRLRLVRHWWPRQIDTSPPVCVRAACRASPARTGTRSSLPQHRLRESGAPRASHTRREHSARIRGPPRWFLAASVFGKHPLKPRIRHIPRIRGRLRLLLLPAHRLQPPQQLEPSHPRTARRLPPEVMRPPEVLGDRGEKV